MIMYVVHAANIIIMLTFKQLIVDPVPQVVDVPLKFKRLFVQLSNLQE
jgi:hypothetical protein